MTKCEHYVTRQETLPEVSPPQRLKSHTDLKVRPCCYKINQSQSQGECGRKHHKNIAHEACCS